MKFISTILVDSVEWEVWQKNLTLHTVCQIIVHWNRSHWMTPMVSKATILHIFVIFNIFWNMYCQSLFIPYHFDKLQSGRLCVMRDFVSNLSIYKVYQIVVCPSSAKSRSNRWRFRQFWIFGRLCRTWVNNITNTDFENRLISN